MAASVKSPRSYDSSSRRAEAGRRRERVLSAARKLFLAHGYAATTVGAVAEAADVSTETVYKMFGRKAGLVRALLDEALLGVGPVPAETRSDLLREATHPRVVVRGWSRLSIEVAPRVVPILILVRDAAVGEPAMRLLYDDMETDRLKRMSDNAGYLAAGGHLRPGVTRAMAADVLFAASSPEMFELLVLRRGWALNRYADFVESTICNGLLPAS